MHKLLSVLDWAIIHFEQETTESLMDIARLIQIKAKEFVRVLTGALQDSITAQEIGMLQVAISMLFYGFYLEFGTVKMPPYPFIRPAIMWVKPFVSKEVWNHLGKMFTK